MSRPFNKKNDIIENMVNVHIAKTNRFTSLPPGTIIYTGSQKNKETLIKLIKYNKSSYQEKDITNIEEIKKYQDKESILWLNIIGVHNTDVLEKIGGFFNIHSLTLEDIANIKQRPKYEEFDDFIFFTSKIMGIAGSSGKIYQEQISIIFAENLLISFQEREPDVFVGIHNRIKENKGRVRKMTVDYLAYLLLDNIIDSYFLLLETLGVEIEKQEESIISNTPDNFSEKNHLLKKNILLLRKAIWPQRELISLLQRSASKLIKKQTRPFINDAYEHVIQIIDTIDTFRDILSGLRDLYLTNLSNRLNEVMKILTIFSTIFIPLTFIAGVYGMNFKYMPELNIPYAYPLLLILMLLIAIVMLIFFKRKKWL